MGGEGEINRRLDKTTVLLLLLLLFLITIMQVIYNYISGVKHVSWGYSVAAVL
jgi:hypothetical protein